MRKVNEAIQIDLNKLNNNLKFTLSNQGFVDAQAYEISQLENIYL